MTQSEYCLWLDSQYWAFELAGFHATACAIAEILRCERSLP